MQDVNNRGSESGGGDKESMETFYFLPNFPVSLKLFKNIKFIFKM